MKNKTKLGLVILMLTLASHSYATCTKNEVMKLVDKGFSKTEISSICGLTKATSIPKRKADKWITPKNSTCRSNGGKIVKGVCSANWQNAKAICRASEERLPSINELKKVITDCGGGVNARDENMGDPNYQSCYKRKGFSVSSGYWSSTTVVDDAISMWGVYFSDGDVLWVAKYGNYYVRCVRGKQ